MEASTEWQTLWIPNAKRPWKRVYGTLACSKLPPVLPLYLCMFLTVALHVPRCPLACSLLYPAHLSFAPLQLFCVKFFTFSFPVVPFPSLLYSLSSYHTFSLSVIFFSSQSYFFLSVILLSRDSVVLSSLSLILFSQCFLRFPNKIYKTKDIKIKHYKENKKKEEKKKKSLCASGGNRSQSFLDMDRTSCHCTNSPTNSSTVRETVYRELNETNTQERVYYQNCEEATTQ